MRSQPTIKLRKNENKQKELLFKNLSNILL